MGTIAGPVLTAALALAEAGIPVFPATENKRPLPEHGFLDASTDPSVVRELWHRWPGPLVGIRTGEISGIDVLDLDRQHGAGAWWKENRQSIPNTRVHRSRSNGLHLLFRHASGLRCSTSRIASGVDVRADGGCVIWWPAAGLQVLADVSLTDLAEWPNLLVEAATPPSRPIFAPRGFPTGGAHGERYAQAALRLAAQRVATAPAGRRNNILNRETFGLARFTVTGALDPRDIADHLTAAALVAGLTPHETDRTIASALRAAGGRK